jgi:hypothetical protein
MKARSNGVYINPLQNFSVFSGFVIEMTLKFEPKTRNNQTNPFVKIGKVGQCGSFGSLKNSV